MENSYTKFLDNQSQLTKKIIEKDINVKTLVYQWWKDRKDLNKIILKQGVKFFVCKQIEIEKLEFNIINFIDNYHLLLFDDLIFNKDHMDKISIKEKNEMYIKSLFNYKVSFMNTRIFNPIELVNEDLHTVLMNYTITTSIRNNKFFFQNIFK